MGMDDASLDGLYGRRAAGRDIGRGFNVALISKSDAKSLGQSVELMAGRMASARTEFLLC
jgi:hypothetical protein